MSLHRPAAGYPAVLDDAPVAVLLAVLAANLVAQKHDASLPKPLAVSQDPWSAPHAVSAGSRRLTARYSWPDQHPAVAKFPKPRSSCESRARSQRHGRAVAILTQSRRRAHDACIHHCDRDRLGVGSHLGGPGAAGGVTHPVQGLAAGGTPAGHKPRSSPQRIPQDGPATWRLLPWWHRRGNRSGRQGSVIDAYHRGPKRQRPVMIQRMTVRPT